MVKAASRQRAHYRSCGNVSCPVRDKVLIEEVALYSGAFSPEPGMTHTWHPSTPQVRAAFPESAVWSKRLYWQSLLNILFKTYVMTYTEAVAREISFSLSLSGPSTIKDTIVQVHFQADSAISQITGECRPFFPSHFQVALLELYLSIFCSHLSEMWIVIWSL